MKTVLPTGFFFSAALLVAGCAQVPDVERGLQTLHFESNSYIAQAGDTIESVAFRYKMTPQQLISLNRHIGSEIAPGDKLVVKHYLTADGSPRAFTGQGWYRGVNYNDGNRQVDSLGAATPHAVSDYPQARGNEIIPDNATVAEIQANYRSGSAGLREEIIPDDLDEPVRSAAPVERRLPPVPQKPNPIALSAWTWPSNGEVARDYAPDEINGQGLDIAGIPGQDVRAAADGTVIYTGRDLSDSGNLVIVRHADGLLTTYSHTRDLYVAEEDFVRAGDPIASLGWNSNRESVLHFEVRKDGKPVNPRLFLPAR